MILALVEAAKSIKTAVGVDLFFRKWCMKYD